MSFEDEFRRNPHRIYRDRRNAWLTGVCAGIADYFGASRFLVRLVTGVLLCIPPINVLVILVYVIAAFRLPEKPEQVFRSRDEEKFWRGVSRAPGDTFGQVRHRMRDLEQRLRSMEAYVTSSQYEIDRELRR